MSYPFFHTTLSVTTIVIILGICVLCVVLRHVSHLSKAELATSLKQGEAGLCQLPETVRNFRQLRQLYYKLQNLERYPEILPRARDTLLLFFAEALETTSASPGILSIESFDEQLLADFVQSEHDSVTKRWEEYTAGRRAGLPRELFKTREDAKRWIKQACPLKYVDGAWLSRINKSTTPFSLQRVTKNAWQILSEEYGDGDLDKHHVHLYRMLMRHVDPALPRGDTEEFIHERHWKGYSDVSSWKSAIGQLLISLFSDEFLPETLGFNLHFEALTEETLIASRELRELRFDPYYFLIHISIDNADSGHTAMALQIIVDYMKHMQETSCPAAVQRAWRGIQTGYRLSQSLAKSVPGIPTDTSLSSRTIHNKYDSALEKIFMSKALASHRIHCNVGTKIGARTLNDWLVPSAMISQRWRRDFLHSLSRTVELVYRGDSRRSKLIQAISWKGKMFGAFTESEVKILSEWIDSLPPLDQTYWDFINETRKKSIDVLTKQTMAAERPVLPRSTGVEVITGIIPSHTAIRDRINANGIDFERLLPIFFAHPCLLESFVDVPSKTATVFACSIIRLIRAQKGFGIEGPNVAGKEETCRTPIGLLEIGLEMVRRQGFDEPTSLQDVRDRWPSDFALYMSRLAMYPTGNVATLLGLTKAFIDLHSIIAASRLLSDASRDALDRIAQREAECLQICLQELEQGDYHKAQFLKGFDYGRREIAACFF